MTTSRHLPPLTQLRAFEAAARHRSFKYAAQELSVTPAAISHQIRELETRLDVRLFERRTRQVVPTAQARQLYPVLRDGFDAFAEALRALSVTNEGKMVTLTTTPAFATQCLLPRLPELQRQHPAIELRLLASDSAIDLDRDNVDIAVRYGGGPFPGHEALRLADDCLLPVASPSLGLRQPTDLPRHHLIHFEWLRDAEHRPAWHDWLHEAGMTHDDASRGLRFSEVNHAIEAAIAGQGVALINRVLVADALTRGVLEAPFGPELDVPGWTLLRHRNRHAGDAQQVVWAWLASLFHSSAAAPQNAVINRRV